MERKTFCRKFSAPLPHAFAIQNDSPRNFFPGAVQLEMEIVASWLPEWERLPSRAWRKASQGQAVPWLAVPKASFPQVLRERSALREQAARWRLPGLRAFQLRKVLPQRERLLREPVP